MEQFFKKFVKSKSMNLIFVSIAVMLFFFILNRNYLSWDNIRNFMNMMSISGIMGIGIAFLLMGGGMNLGAGAEGCICALCLALLMQNGLPWPPALLIALVGGVITGLINSFFINRLNLLGFITTLGMASVYKGLSQWFSGNMNIAISNQSFWQVGSFALFGVIPMPFIILVCLMIIYGFILAKTRFGRSILMCGGNRAAARLAGINPKKILTILYINCGVLSTLAGSVLAARMHNSSPTALATGALDAITASVLGGVSFMGGSGSLSGLFFGLILLSAFNNGLLVINLPAYSSYLSQGALLIIALCIDFFSSKARAASLKRAEEKEAA